MVNSVSTEQPGGGRRAAARATRSSPSTARRTDTWTEASLRHPHPTRATRSTLSVLAQRRGDHRAGHPRQPQPQLERERRLPGDRPVVPDAARRGARRRRRTASPSWGTIMQQSVTGLGRIFSPGGLQNYGRLISGDPNADQNERLLSPVGAVKVGTQVAETSFGDLLLLLAAINIFVGLLNLIPLLPVRRRPHRHRHLRGDPVPEGPALPGRHPQAAAGQLRGARRRDGAGHRQLLPGPREL